MATKIRNNKSNIRLREKRLNEGNMSLYLDIYHNGKRTYEFLKLYIKNKPQSTAERIKNRENLQLAESIRSKRENEIKNQEYGFTPAFKTKTNFIDYFQAYVDSYPNKDKRLIVSSLNHFKKFTGKKNISPAEIDENLLVRFKKYLDNTLHGETPFNYFKKLKKVLKQAHKDKIFPENPAAYIKNTKTEGLKKEVLNFEEIQRLAETPCGNDEIKRAFLFSLNTGLRYVEVKNLTWYNIDNDKIIIRAQSKTGKPVYVDLNANARKLMGEPGKTTDQVFQMPASGHNKVLKNWMKKAGITKHITYHCARHSFGVNLIIQRADIKTVSGLMGHSSIRQTEIYTRFVDKLKREAVDSLPDLNF